MPQTDASFNAMLSSVRSLLLILASLLAAHGLASTGLYFWVQLIAGSIVAVGMALWGCWSAFVNWRKASAVGVQAGINLTVSGKAIDTAGNIIPVGTAAGNATPPKAVTISSAAQIVKDFAPSVPPAK